MNNPAPAPAAPPVRTPYFFFSYARRDFDSYLERFYRDLCDAIEAMAAEEEVGFQDLSAIEPGEDWEEQLASALQTSRTMLCIYSPWYFNRPYCGKEFRVFLERQPSVRFDEEGAARNSTHIIPVLWLRKADLVRLGLPPAAVQYIAYSVERHKEAYEERGLKGILKRRSAAYHDILEQLADQVVNRSLEDPPLPPLPARPSLRQVPSAFDVIAATPAAATPGATARGVAPTPRASSSGGPRVLVPVYLGVSAEGASDWSPFPEEIPEGLRSLIGAVATGQGVRTMEHWLDPASGPAGQDLAALLRAATARNEIPLVIVNPGLAPETIGPVIEGLLADSGWRGGILIPADAADETAARGIAAVRAAMEAVSWDPDRVLVRIFTDRPATLEPALSATFAELRRRVVAAGEVMRTVAAEGPARKPILSGPHRSDGR